MMILGTFYPNLILSGKIFEVLSALLSFAHNPIHWQELYGHWKQCRIGSDGSVTFNRRLCPLKHSDKCCPADGISRTQALCWVSQSHCFGSHSIWFWRPLSSGLRNESKNIIFRNFLLLAKDFLNYRFVRLNVRLKAKNKFFDEIICQIYHANIQS